jgi:hypothetical protein
VGCSLVGLKRKTLEKKEGKKRMMSEGLEEGSVAPLELFGAGGSHGEGVEEY